MCFILVLNISTNYHYNYGPRGKNHKIRICEQNLYFKDLEFDDPKLWGYLTQTIAFRFPRCFFKRGGLNVVVKRPNCRMITKKKNNEICICGQNRHFKHAKHDNTSQPFDIWYFLNVIIEPNFRVFNGLGVRFLSAFLDVMFSLNTSNLIYYQSRWIDN